MCSSFVRSRDSYSISSVDPVERKLCSVTAARRVSCSVSSEMVTCLRGHTGLVKGLTWDPVGKYIASQADDHSLKVWRTLDWQLEANITKPFSEVRQPVGC